MSAKRDKQAAKAKLGTLKLNDAQKEAIAELVASDGFKVLAKVIIPTREIQIGGSLMNMGMTIEDLWYYKGMSYENSRTINKLQEIADKWNKEQLDEDAKD